MICFLYMPFSSQRSRTQSEATSVEDGELMPSKSESKASEDQQTASSLLQDQHSGRLKINNDGADGLDIPKNSADLNNVQSEISDENNGDFSEEGAGGDDIENSTAADLKQSSGFTLSETSLSSVSTETKQFRVVVSVGSMGVSAGENMSETPTKDANQEETCVAGAGSENGDVKKTEASSKKLKAPLLLRQKKMRESLGFIPTDSIANEENLLSSSNSNGQSEERKMESYNKRQNQTSLASAQNSGNQCFMTSAEPTEFQNERESKGSIVKRMNGSEDNHGSMDSSHHLSHRSPKEGNPVSKRESGCITTRLSCADKEETLEKSSQDVKEDENNSSAHVPQDSCPLIEFYVIKSPTLASVGKQVKSQHSSNKMEISSEEKVMGDTISVEEGKSLDLCPNKMLEISDKVIASPPKMVRRRSRRLSDVSGICEQELSLSDKIGRLQSPDLRKRLAQSRKEGSSWQSVTDESVAKLTESEILAENSVSDIVSEHVNTSTTVGQKRRTRSSSISENIEQNGKDGNCSIEKLPVRKSRRSVRKSSSFEELKAQANSINSQSDGDIFRKDKQIGNSSSTQSLPGLRSKRRSSAQSVQINHHSKIKNTSTRTVIPSVSTAELTDPVNSLVVKCEPTLSDDDRVPCIKFGPEISIADPILTPKLELISPSTECNSLDIMEIKPSTLIQEENLSGVHQQAQQGGSGKQDSVGQKLTRSRYKRLSQTSDPEKFDSVKVEDEKDCLEGKGLIEYRQEAALTPLTRRTQMEIAAQQLAKMLMAAKNSEKKAQTGSRIVTRALNTAKDSPASSAPGRIPTEVGLKTRSRGRSRKAPLIIENSGGNDPPKASSTPNKEGLRQKRVTEQHDKIITKSSEDKEVRDDIESDLDTSSLSSDADEVQNKKTPAKKNLKMLVKRQSQLKKKVANAAIGKGSKLSNSGSCEEQKQQNVMSSSTHSEVLPTLSCSDSENEMHKPGSEKDAKQLQRPDTPEQRENDLLHSTDSLVLPALSSSDSDSEEETSKAGAGKVTKGKQEVMDLKTSGQISQEQMAVDSCLVFNAEKPTPGRRRGRLKLTRGKHEESAQVKTTSIRVDNGNTAKPINDLRLKSKEFSLVKQFDERGDKEVEEEQVKSYARNRGSLGNISGSVSLKKNDGNVIGESRVKSKEFISSSSEDDEEKVTGKEKHVNSQSIRESPASLKESQHIGPSCEASDMAEVSGNKGHITKSGYKFKRLHCVPHLLSSFVPSQFSAFKATKSPKRKNESDSEFPLPVADNTLGSGNLDVKSNIISNSDSMDKSRNSGHSAHKDSYPIPSTNLANRNIETPAKLKFPSSQVMEANTLDTKSDSIPVCTKRHSEDLTQAKSKKNISELETNSDSLPVCVEKQAKSSAQAKSLSKSDLETNSDGLPVCVEEQTESPTQANDLNRSELGSDGDECLLQIVEDGGPDLAGLCGAAEATEGEDLSDLRHTSNTVIKCDNHVESKEGSSNRNSSVEPPGMAQKCAKDDESIIASRCSPLGNKIASSSVATQRKLEAKKGRKRKALMPEDDGTIDKELESCNLTLKYVFSFFQVTRCLSPLPRSPSPKRVCRVDEVQNPSESLVKFSAAAPDKATTVTPAPTRLPLVRLELERVCDDGTDNEDDGQFHDNTESSAKDIGDKVCKGRVSSGSSVHHQSRTAETASMSLSHQMMQAKKLLKARRKPAEIG